MGKRLNDIKSYIFNSDKDSSKLSVGTRNKIVRDEWIENALKKIPAGKKILDAGAGELQYKKYCSHLEYVAQDLGEYDGSGNQEGLHTQTWDNSMIDIKSDIVSIPVPDESFDAIMCTEVFEHIVEPVNAVKEFARIIRPGGYLIITAPFASFTHFAPFYFANGYSRYWYEEVLGRYGFIIEDFSPNGNYFEFIAQELRRISSMAKRYSNTDISERNKRSINDLLWKLQELSEKDSGSNEFLVFGNHVFATKQ